jgi:hypothetical protein
LAGPTLDRVLNGVEACQLSGPTAGAGWAEDQTSNVLAAHTLIGADSFHTFTAFWTFEVEDVSEFAASVGAGDTFHYRQNSVELHSVLYQ